MSRLIDEFWEEHEAFVQWKGFFNQAHIWLSAEKEDTLAHEWHKRYSLPFTEVFGQVVVLHSFYMLRDLGYRSSGKTGRLLRQINLGSGQI